MRPGLAVAAIVGAAFVLYAALASNVGSPRVFTDELLYLEAAASIADGDGLSVHGERYEYAPLYPLVLSGVVAVAPDRGTTYELAKILNALLFALSAIPLFLLARRLLGPWQAVTASAASVALPSAMYVSVVMTESLAFLACSWAFLAIALALERPTAPRQLGALVAIALAASVRIQLALLVGVYLLGLALVAVLVPRRRPTRATMLRLWPTGIALACAVAALGIRVAQGSAGSVLGAYSDLWRGYDAGEVARWFVYHLANLELYVAVIPLAVAPIVLASCFSRARRGSERDAAFLALFLISSVAFLLVAAAFNSTVFAEGALHDRPLFYVVPLWIVLLFVWVARGAPRPLLALGIGAALALVLPLLLPLHEYARDEPRQQFNAAATPLWTALDEAVRGAGVPTVAIVGAFCLALVLAAVFLPSRLIYLAPVAVISVLAVEAELAWAGAERFAEPWAVLAKPERAWVDRSIGGVRDVTLLTAGECARPQTRAALFVTEFFNESIDGVVHMGSSPEALPSQRVRSARDGALLAPTGAPLVADYVVAPRSFRLDGRLVGRGTSERLALWEVGGPVRVLGGVPSACPAS